MIVFVHGAGRSGPDSWPHVDRPDAVFLDLTPFPDVDAQAQFVESQIGRGDTVVAHSLGAVLAVLALTRHRVARSIVLLEPALYDTARGVPEVEDHIAAMERARGAFANDGPRAFWRIVRPMMFGGPFDEQAWPQEEPIASRFATIPLPWGHGLTASDVVTAPTTVITGNWNPEYEAIALALTGAGARHLVWEGSGHRPQDDPRFASLLDDIADAPHGDLIPPIGAPPAGSD